MDDIDRLLVNALQDGIAICARPFADLARRAGLSEEQVVARVERLQQQGDLSRFGPMFNAEAIGGEYVLAAMAVPALELGPVIEVLNTYPQVAHNYQRDHRFNIWFVVAASRRGECEQVLADIEGRTGIAVKRLPREREYFINARFAA
jgi:DNA-binding Lrp family transcriptional regulator